MKYKYIVWDWNGTLYDDVQIGIDAMNEMLRLKGYNIFLTPEKYREIFCFPIIDYYKRIGYDFSHHPFEELAELYIEIYCSIQNKAQLYPSAKSVLNELQNKGARQVIVSACEKNRLKQQINSFGITDYFDDIVGIDDNLAKGKIQLAQQWIKDKGLSAKDIVFIGDTTHDYEVAKSVGCDCILVADGHQSANRLRQTGENVVNTLCEVIQYL